MRTGHSSLHARGLHPGADLNLTHRNVGDTRCCVTDCNGLGTLYYNAHWGGMYFSGHSLLLRPTWVLMQQACGCLFAILPLLS